VVYADELADIFGVDAVRYYALSEMPYATDGSITYEAVISRYNNDLANNLGNLVSRTHAMTKKYFGGVVPAPDATDALDGELVAACVKAYDGLIGNMDEFRIADALDCVFEMLSRANKYIDETTPWTLAKDEGQRERLGTVLYNLLEAIRWGAVMLAPFIPATAEEILATLGTDKTGYDTIGTADKFCGMKAGDSVAASKVLFARIDEAKTLEGIYAEIAAAQAAKEAAEKKVEKPEGCAIIGFDDFMKVELRTAKIIACESVPKAKKLLKLQIDLGYEQRQIVSGIAKFYKPEELIGKKVILVCNLKPAVLCGEESNGMILASGDEEIKVVFLDDSTPLGSRVR
jgi:methionyl-tRNA synthetase